MVTLSRLISIWLLVSLTTGCGALGRGIFSTESIREEQMQVGVRTDPPGAEITVVRGDVYETIGRAPVEVEVPYEARRKSPGPDIAFALGTGIDLGLVFLGAALHDWDATGDDDDIEFFEYPWLTLMASSIVALILDTVAFAAIRTPSDVPRGVRVLAQDDRGRWDSTNIFVPNVGSVNLRPDRDAGAAGVNLRAFRLGTSTSAAGMPWSIELETMTSTEGESLDAQ